MTPPHSPTTWAVAAPFINRPDSLWISDFVESVDHQFVKVVHNGVLLHENVSVPGPTAGGLAGVAALGPLRLQPID